MNQSMQPAIRHLFQVSTLEDVSREQLEAMVEEYPCFGFGHYLLSRKLRSEDADRFLSATQKTNLYFPNPFWLDWMLVHPLDQDRDRTVAHETATFEKAPAPSAAVEPFPSSSASAAADPWSDMKMPEHPDGAGTLQTDALLVDPESPAQEEFDDASMLLKDSIEKAKELRESLQKINEDFVAQTGHPIPTREPIQDPVAAPVQESVPEAVQEPVQEWTEPATEAAVIAADGPILDEEPAFILDEPEQAAEQSAALAVPVVPEAATTSRQEFTESTVAPQEYADPTTAESPEPTPALAESQGPAVVAETPLVFEPLHTIDYFASQGIRLTLEDNPTDHLGRQLRSFTEWLKTMRRLPQKSRNIIPDRVAEQAVQNFAAHSIEGKEVVTETMAEVLAKQGMPERARIVYEKLSLLNPDKSAYFAAKIEQLNSH